MLTPFSIRIGNYQIILRQVVLFPRGGNQNALIARQTPARLPVYFEAIQQEGHFGAAHLPFYCRLDGVAIGCTREEC
jgi:hypothetical protein